MGLAGEEEVLFLPYEMTVGSYPAFNCGVIFPKNIFGESSDFTPEQTATIEQATQEEAGENTQDMQTATDKTDSEESEKEPDIVEGSDGEEPKQKQPSADETPAGEIQEQDQTGQVPEDTADSEKAVDGVAEEEAVEISKGPSTGKIYEAIQKITQSPAVLPGQSAMAKNATPGINGDFLEICANDIMQNQITWASPDDSLQQALAKMQQTDAGYIMIGRDGAIEGIIPKSDVTKAMSPYLLPIFAKWRRLLDDATLKIRIKWIMSRPVRTIKPETSLAAILEYMSRFRGRCLPVTDEENNVQGLVTAFDIFLALLKSSPNTAAAGRTPVESTSPTGIT